MITNHYGHTVNSEEAITGVHSIRDLDWDAYDYLGSEICLDCGEANENLDDEQDGYGRYDYNVECDSSHTKLFGDWIECDMKDDDAWFVAGDKGYKVDKSKEFSAIMRESVIQVVWSKFTERHNLCSPCYPGQGDADSDGEYLCFVLPLDMLNQKEN